MPAYAHVTGGQVTHLADTKESLPATWRYDDGRTVSGFNLLDEDEILDAGWVVVTDQRPTPGPSEQLVGPEVTVSNGQVTRTWTKQPIPPAPTPDPSIAKADEAEARLAALADKGWANLSATEKTEVAQRAMEAIGFRRKARGT